MEVARSMRSPARWIRTGGVCLSLASSTLAGAAEAPFELFEIPSPGRTVAAEFADLNGDGRTDLLQLVFQGVPPGERRSIRAYLQSADGLPDDPTYTWPLPPGTAAYDLADVAPSPGEELLLLREKGVSILSLAHPELEQKEITVPERPTLATSEDDRGLDRLRLFRSELGSPPRLVVPQPGRIVVLSVEGEVHGILEVGARTNYLIPPRPGPVLFESEVQVFLDAPRVSIGDFDGDGRADIVTSSRHELRVFLQRLDGTFPRHSDRALPLARVSARDHVRGLGSVRAEARDLNGDGRIDLLVSHNRGALTDATSSTSLYLNRDGEWNLDHADQSFENDGAWTNDQLIDLDGDGRLELIRVSLPFSVLEMIELLVTRAIDAEVEVFHHRDGIFDPEPWAQKKLGVPISFETYRPRGFVPTVQVDLNGDGHLDLISSGGGKRIEVLLGGPERRFKRRNARQDADSRGRIRFGDLDRDGLPDFLLYDPRQPDVPVRIARNRGVLPAE